MKDRAQPSRRSGLSFLLSFLLPGLGQVYNGEFSKGILFYFANFALCLGLLLSSLRLFFALGLLLLARILISAEAARRSAKARDRRPLRRYQRWTIYILLFLLGSVGGRYGLRALVPPIEVVGVSMEPTLLSGDQALSDRIVYWLRPPRGGDIVVLENPLKEGGLLVKRVVAVGKSEFVLPGGRSWEVPEGHVFVLSDNRRRAPDSRWFGPVPVESVKANLFKIYWSWDKKRERVRWKRIGRTIR